MPVFISNEQTEYFIDCKKLEKQITRILILLECKNQEVSILLTDDKRIRKLNNNYRGQNHATDVLSFSQNEHGGEDEGQNHNLLGDVIISTITAKKQSIEHGLSFDQEIVLLLIHGILHLLGFDHERSNKEARHMKEKTRELFSQVFPDKNPTESCNF